LKKKSAQDALRLKTRGEEKKKRVGSLERM